MRSSYLFLSIIAFAVAACPVAASSISTNIVPNPSFEAGETGPGGWGSFAVGGAEWAYDGVDGERCVSVTGLGEDTAWWAVKGSLALEQNRVYSMSYWVRQGADARDGTVIAGLEQVNRDAQASAEWERRSFHFRTPDEAVSNALFRVGQWHMRGKVFLDQVMVQPAVAVQGRPAVMDIELGAGERVEAGSYRASHEMSGPGSTDFRCLERFTARFNTNRWAFEGTGEVVYRHAVGRLRQREPEVEVGVSLLERGSLLIEASADGKKWVAVGEIGKVARAAFAIPREVLPAREMWVRLRSGPGTYAQVNAYTYRCRLTEGESAGRLIGDTQYVTVVRDSPEIGVELKGLGSLRPGTDGEADVIVKNEGLRRSFRLRLVVTRDGAVVDESDTRFSLSPKGSRRVTLPYSLEASGRHSLKLICVELPSEEVLWEGQSEFTVSPLYDARGGGLLHEDGKGAIWWCEPEWKVGRERLAPRAVSGAVRIEAAANEYEAAQVVVRPRAPLGQCSVRVGDLVSASGSSIPAGEVEIRTVEYVFTARPTDELGTVDEWPDPLPIHASPVNLAAGRNQPFWVSVHVPPGTPGGDYRGMLTVEGAGWSAEVPLEVHVWDFELPRGTHLRSGFGLSRWSLKRYHNLDTDDEVQQVYRLYLRSFAEHRVAPYSLGRDIEVEWTRDAREGLYPKVDFIGFDEDARFGLDELGFNSFRLDLDGLGGGTYQSRRPGRIGEFEEGSREHQISFGRYAGTVQKHLERNGWLDKAYVYWFDEPTEKDYEFVQKGMELIGGAAPKVKRLLTEEPVARLYDSVDIWCLPTFMLDVDVLQSRKSAGDEVWWYLCTAPKAPHFALFIDHYGTELRLWSWETWKYGLKGLLVWQSVYWTSRSAYPGEVVQNPWEDSMSWKSGYGLPEGGREPWGNGDGRFLYPPNRRPGLDKTKYLEGPVPSIRWELLRDGIEDYEYLWLLREEVQRLKGAGAPAASYAEAESLLEVPAEVCTSLTEFATTPEPIHAHRARVAEAIEGLRGM